MEVKEVLENLESLKNEKFREGMVRFGIRPKTKILGTSIPVLRKIARDIGRNHQLALKLFKSNIHEARLLASMIAEPSKLTEKQFDQWVKTFDSWDVVDNACGNLFDKTPFAYRKIFELAKRKEEFVKRTAFALVAYLAVHDKIMKDNDFIRFFPLIKKESVDERNFVKKSVNWALRQIGKRNEKLNKEALKLASEILKINSKSAKWIAKDAIRELENWKHNK